MAGLDPAIHDFRADAQQTMAARDKPGHDTCKAPCFLTTVRERFID
jgi:hypothetical protein